MYTKISTLLSLVMLIFCISACDNPANTPAASLQEEKAMSLRKMTTEEDAGMTAAAYFKNPFESIDNYARATTADHEKDIPTLAKYLTKNCETDLQKARAIYVWLAQNVSYDARGFNTLTFGDCSAEAVLKSRVSVCEGFSNLFKALGEDVGLEIQKVSGYAKGLGYASNNKFDQPNHAWNRIKIDGEWRIFDATWGEGYAKSQNGKIACIKKFDNYWFNVSPYLAIFDHYPTSTEPLPLLPDVDLAAFKQLPKIPKSYFRAGFDPKKTYQKVRKEGKIDLPKSYDIKTPVKVLDAPAEKYIAVGQEHRFELVIPAALKVAMIDENGKWQYFSEIRKGFWEYSHIPKNEGKVSIAIKTGTDGNNFNILMMYKVEQKKNTPT